ncbi:sugar ABC transporter ATP-binding protein [Kaistia sp. 32K]|uniref:ABC transporter ATP-binding protein n=1 Tax=Kaistia sp. 32K TaxID=2795690 RepID=UPI00193782F2|nr:ABC transporter ATP-binding protein [Kaistia sp. 32K]BCP56343.1 sugar ABC transporter ATP-binding protein [Kaistia sp. 32K]
MSSHANIASPPPTAALAPPQVVVDRVLKTHPGATRPVLNNLSIECPAGKVTIIVGPSGCGKTTLLRSLCGLETIDSGAIRFDQTEVTHVDAQRRGVAMVFQNYALYPAKTVAENIAFPLRMAGVDAAERARRVQAAASLVRIEALLERMPAQLSGGQRQRVGIARAIVRGPRVLLMDEPLSNLDTKLRTEMRIELATLQRQLGATTVYVTHDQSEALALADHLVVLREGVVEQCGSPEAIFRRPATAFVADFLGSMNIVSGTQQAERFVPKEGGEMALPATAGRAAEGPFSVGFRAEEVHLGTPDAASLCFSAQVVRSELLGADSLVHLSLGGASLKARLAETLKAGEVVPLKVEARHLHLFDAGGRRISAGDIA